MLSVPSVEDAHQPSRRDRDQDAAHPPLLHALGDVRKWHVWTDRGRAGFHHRFDRGLRVGVERLSAQEAKDDASVVHHDAYIVARCPHALARVAQPGGDGACGGIAPGGVSGGGGVGQRTFQGEPACRPVRLACDIVEDLSEAQALEPPRGPGAKVSLMVGAVDDDGPVSVEAGGCLAAELLQRDVYRSLDVLFTVLPFREDFHELCALREEPLNVVSSDDGRHSKWPGKCGPGRRESQSPIIVAEPSTGGLRGSLTAAVCPLTLSGVKGAAAWI